MIPIYVGLGLLAGATLLLEISLTRTFSLAQFYHFAFMAVSLALLGFGASGSLLVLRPRWREAGWERRLTIFAFTFALTDLAGYLLTNYLPFDSFSIAWDRRQVLYLLLYFLVPALPFISAGLAIGLALAAAPLRANRLYGANLIGSALGCLVAVIVPLAWGPRAIPLSAALAAGAGLCFAWNNVVHWRIVNGVTLGGCLLLLIASPAWLEVRLSPYKGLRQALLYPNAHTVAIWQNAYSRVDLVESGGVRMLPGLSYTYGGDLPSQWGVTVDGDDLSPVLLTPPDETPPFADYLPAALAFRLHPDAKVLILEAGGGLDPLAALALNARAVTVQEGNELVLDAALVASPGGVYADERVRVVRRDERGFLQADPERYDIIQLSLTQPFRPVTSGAYSLAENFTLTVEAFAQMLRHLEPEGVLAVTRWSQTPPSEDLRVLALAIEGLERLGIPDPQGHIIAFRGIQTVTVLVKRDVFTAQEMVTVGEFSEARRYDLVVAPGLQQGESNRFNVQPEPVHFETFNALMGAPDRQAFYAAYPFAVTPPTDDHPFFFHFFRWGQTPTILQSLGKTWQPFGGSGYFVLLALLALATLAALFLIVLPLLLGRRSVAERADLRPVLRPFLYFSLIGIGFLWLEIALIGRFMLTLAHPAYALAGVLFSLLFFSGLGSLTALRLPWRYVFTILILTGLGVAVGLPPLLYRTLGWPLWWRFVLTVLVLAPLGFFLGIPFPKGLAWLGRTAPNLIPWAWAVNGSISVIASVLAAILILSLGYRAVLLLGSLAYCLAYLVIVSLASEGRRSPP